METNIQNVENNKKMAYLVGAGPGAADLITLRGRELIKQCDVLIYDALVGEQLVGLAKTACHKIYVGKRAGHHSMKQEEISKLLVEECEPGRIVVRLKGGDPFVFGRGGEEIQALIEAGIDFEVVPGVTSAIAAAELCNIPVTHRGVAGSFVVLTGHSKNDEVLTESFETLVRFSGTIVILMGVKNGAQIAKGLIAAGKAEDTPIAFIENASLSEQKLTRGKLSEVAGLVEEGKIHAPAVLLIGEVAAFPNVIRQKKIIVTGTEHFVSLMKQRDSSYVDGHNLQVMPIIHEIPEQIKKCKWILFTSGYGVTIFFELCKRNRIDIRTFHMLRFAAIGKDTASYLEKIGIYPEFVASRAEGYAFGKEFSRFLHQSGLKQDCVDSSDIVLLRAKKASKGLPKALDEEGIAFTDIALYDTFAMADRTQQTIRWLAEGNSDCEGVVFGSRSAAEALLETVDRQTVIKEIFHNKTVFAMGNSMKEYLLEQGIDKEQIMIPDEPGVDNLTNLIQQVMRGI